MKKTDFQDEKVAVLLKKGELMKILKKQAENIFKIMLLQ